MQALTETQKKPLYTLCPEFASMRFSYTKLGGWNNLSVQEAMENGPGIEGFLNAVNSDLWTKWYRVSKNLDRDNGIAIGNVQLFVNLIFILYARWRFKIICLQTKLASLAIRKKI